MKLLPFSKCPIYFKNQFNKEQNNFFLKAFVTLYFFFSVGSVYSGTLIHTSLFGRRVLSSPIIFDMLCIFYQQY